MYIMTIAKLSNSLYLEDQISNLSVSRLYSNDDLIKAGSTLLLRGLVMYGHS